MKARVFLGRHRVAAALAIFFAASLPGPARAENVPASRLQEFLAVMPAAPAGWTRREQIGTYSSDHASTATAAYTGPNNAYFTIVVTFSRAIAQQNAALIKDAGARKSMGMDAVTIRGREALARRADNANRHVALFLVVLGNRTVSAVDLTGTADPATVRATFEKIDFAAVAAK
jgi:hypothetical protein